MATLSGQVTEMVSRFLLTCLISMTSYRKSSFGKDVCDGQTRPMLLQQSAVILTFHIFALYRTRSTPNWRLSRSAPKCKFSTWRFLGTSVVFLKGPLNPFGLAKKLLTAWNHCRIDGSSVSLQDNLDESGKKPRKLSSADLNLLKRLKKKNSPP